MSCHLSLSFSSSSLSPSFALTLAPSLSLSCLHPCNVVSVRAVKDTHFSLVVGVFERAVARDTRENLSGETFFFFAKKNCFFTRNILLVFSPRFLVNVHIYIYSEKMENKEKGKDVEESGAKNQNLARIILCFRVVSCVTGKQQQPCSGFFFSCRDCSGTSSLQ